VRRTTQILTSTEAGDARDVALSLSPELPRARIDAEKLRQVLMNLVQNAHQAMNGGTVNVATRLRRAPATFSALGVEGAPWIEIAVSDRGPGISQVVLKNLFVPFFTTKAAGTGLGLAISQRIVQAAGGSIDVTTREGEGTTFSVLLPPVDDAERTPRPPELAPDASLSRTATP
jgi:signal transduction histidine kinase